MVEVRRRRILVPAALKPTLAFASCCPGLPCGSRLQKAICTGRVSHWFHQTIQGSCRSDERQRPGAVKDAAQVQALAGLAT